MMKDVKILKAVINTCIAKETRILQEIADLKTVIERIKKSHLPCTFKIPPDLQEYMEEHQNNNQGKFISVKCVFILI
jgi:hypothetical protein